VRHCHCTETTAVSWNVTKDVRRSSSWSVVILSYPQYCRYRAVQRRLEMLPASTAGGGMVAQSRLTDTILRAIGRPSSVANVARVMFCRATFCHPELDEHEFRRDLLSMSLCLSASLSVFCWALLSVCVFICLLRLSTWLMSDWYIQQRPVARARITVAWIQIQYNTILFYWASCQDAA